MVKRTDLCSGAWYTKDGSGDFHSESGMPSCRGEDGSGFIVWEEHGSYHRMSGVSCVTSDNLRFWHLCNQNLHGRLLLWN